MGVNAKEFAKQADVAYNENWGYIWATAGENWTEAKQKNLEAKYNSDPGKYADYEQGATIGSKWIGHMVTDCSGLVKWALAKLGLKGIYHGSNSQFRKNCSKTGKIVKGEKIPVGALIFTGDESTHNHVGILTSETCVTEARSTAKGVVHTPLSNRKWTYWGLVKGVDYDTKSDPIPESVTLPVTMEVTFNTLRKGAKGNEVVVMQKLLLDAGESLPKFGVDGDFGNETLKAVKSFQKKKGLVVDGIVGPKTWAELMTYA